jgi:hypothetical protein
MTQFTLQHFAASMLMAVISLGNIGCARTETRPSEPPAPLSSIVMVPPISSWAFNDPSGQRRAGGAVIVPVVVGRGVNTGNSIGVGVGVALIGLAIQHGVAQRKQELDSATAKVGFSPADILNVQLLGRVQAAGVKIQSMPEGDSMTIFHARRDQQFFKSTKVDADAVLDVRVDEQGFYHSSRAGGYSPMLGITATLWTAANPDDSESFSYYADFRQRPSDSRWITTPPTLTFPTLEDLTHNAEAAKADLELMLGKVMDLIARDVKDRVEGRVRVP